MKSTICIKVSIHSIKLIRELALRGCNHVKLMLIGAQLVELGGGTPPQNYLNKQIYIYITASFCAIPIELCSSIILSSGIIYEQPKIV